MNMRKKFHNTLPTTRYLQKTVSFLGLIILSSLPLLTGCGAGDNASNASQWLSAEICYYKDLDSYTNSIPQVMETNNSEEIRELELMLESLRDDPTSTSKPMSFPRYVVTLHGDDFFQSFSVDSESVYTADGLDNGNYISSAGLNLYGKIADFYKP